MDQGWLPRLAAVPNKNQGLMAPQGERQEAVSGQKNTDFRGIQAVLLYFFDPKRGPNVTAFLGEARYSLRQNRQKETGDQPMRLLIACAIIVSATIGLGGCFGHHEKAVVVEPLKLG
jgi:hypothetical protein